MKRTTAALLLLSGAISLTAPQSTLAVTISTVPVGNLGNANDPADGDYGAAGIQQRGAVNYSYNIGTTEVTIGQYTSFLNAVAATDTYSLYNPNIGIDTRVGRIARTGTSGSYSYSIVDSPNLPVTWINWGDAARFTNWLQNGQPTGPQSAATTEDGAYTLNGATVAAALNSVVRNSVATWVIPSENEWYKAAYHKNDGVTGNFWTFPTRSNTVPYSDQPPGADAPSPSNTGNLYANDSIANGYNDGFAAIGSPTNINDSLVLTNVGAYISAVGPYGTYDQGGNVIEYTEAFASYNGNRMARGASYVASANDSRSSNHLGVGYVENNNLGFRVATLGNRATVETVNAPSSTPLGGGSAAVGGVVVDLTASSTGSFQQTYTNYNVGQLPPLPAFAPGNFLLSVPGSTLQYWDLHYSGTFDGTANVTFTFDPSLIPSGAQMGIWHFEEGTGWEFLGGTIQGNTITFATDSFSPFALAAVPVPEPASCVILGLGLTAMLGYRLRRRSR